MIGELTKTLQGGPRGDVRCVAAVANSRPRQCVRLPDDGRGSARSRPARIAEGGCRRSCSAAQSNPGFLRIGFTTFSDNSPQIYLDIDRTMARSLGVSVNDVFQTLQTYLGSTYVNLFNKFNQSFQVRVQAGADYRRELQDISNLYVANKRRPDGAAGRAAERPPRARVGTGHALQSLSRGIITGIPMPKYSSGQAMDMMGKFADADSTARHGLRMDRAFLSGEY